jgi:hypothetical protein
MVSSRELSDGSDLDFGEILFYILCTVVGILIGLFVIYLKKGRKEPYEFLVINMRAGVNAHKKIKGESLEFETTIDNKKIKIMPDRLYRVKSGRVRKILDRFYGIKQRFLVIYQKGKKEPIKPPSVKVSARILKQVNESRALGKSLSSEFSVPMDLKKILIIFGFVLVVIVAWYIVQMGGIPV